MRGGSDSFDLRGALEGELIAARDALAAPDTVERTHRARVAIKRARALMRIGADAAPGIAQIFNAEARLIMHALAGQRDLAAQEASARAAAESAEPRGRAALLRIARALKAARDAAPPADEAALSERLAALIALIQVWPTPSARQVRRGLKRLLRRAREAFADAKGKTKERARHRWRKREKDRLYAAMLAAPAWPGGARRRVKRAQRLSDRLGAERDVLLLMARLEENADLAGSAKARKVAMAALKTRHAALARRADRLGARLHKNGA